MHPRLTPDPRRLARWTAVAALVLAGSVLALAGCGGGSSGGYTEQAVSQTSERRVLPSSLSQVWVSRPQPDSRGCSDGLWQ